MKARYDVYERLRDINGLTDSDVAKATGVHRSTFSDWKSGRSSPKNDKILKLVRFFNVNYYDFFEDNGMHTPFESGKYVTDSEYEIIIAIRQHPEMLEAVMKLLDMREKKDSTVQKEA